MRLAEGQVVDRDGVGPREVMDHSIGKGDACVPDEGQEPCDQGELSPHDAEGEPRIIRVDPARWS